MVNKYSLNFLAFSENFLNIPTLEASVENNASEFQGTISLGSHLIHAVLSPLFRQVALHGGAWYGLPRGKVGKTHQRCSGYVGLPRYCTDASRIKRSAALLDECFDYSLRL